MPDLGPLIFLVALIPMPQALDMSRDDMTWSNHKALDQAGKWPEGPVSDIVLQSTLALTFWFLWHIVFVAFNE